MRLLSTCSGYVAHCASSPDAPPTKPDAHIGSTYDTSMIVIEQRGSLKWCSCRQCLRSAFTACVLLWFPREADDLRGLLPLILHRARIHTLRVKLFCDPNLFVVRGSKSLCSKRHRNQVHVGRFDLERVERAKANPRVRHDS